MRFPLLAKVGAIALVGAMVMVCLGRIEGLVDERRARGDEAVRGVEQSHAAAQSVVGPLMMRHCTETWETSTDSLQGRTTTTLDRAFTLQAVPTKLVVAGRTRAEPLYRGLFKVNAWAGRFDASAEFAPLPQPHAEHAGSRMACGAPTLYVGLSDVRGVRTAAVTVGGQALAVAPGTPNPAYTHGFGAALPPALVDGEAAARPVVAQVSIDLVGTAQVAWVPAAGTVQWALASDWPHPSFGGKFLPDVRTVRADGFDATWNLSALATTAGADALAGAKLCRASTGDDPDDAGASGAPASAGCLDSMAVSFIDPVNPYVLSDRAVKYAALFVVLTFVAVGLIEVLSGRRVHPVQYLLVGLALSVFFLLLLSLSEHVAFVQAYVAAATACASLLGFYASAMFGRRAAGLAFGAAIGALYGLLYALLQMEQNALVIGSVMLFAGLAIVMVLTRRIDWYALFGRLRAGAAAPGGDAAAAEAME